MLAGALALSPPLVVPPFRLPTLPNTLPLNRWLRRWMQRVGLVAKAVGMTSLTSGSSDTDATSYNTASITPTANRLVLLAVANTVASGTPNTPTVSGNSLTWVEVATVLRTSTSRLTLFRALGTPTSGATNIAYGGQTQTSCAWSMAEFVGVDTSGTNGSGAVVQSGTNTATATSLTVTLAAFGSVNNATYGTFFVGLVTAITPGAGFSEIHDVAFTNEGNNRDLESEWRSDNDTTVDASWTGSNQAAGIAIEIRAAAAAAAFTPRVIIL